MAQFQKQCEEYLVVIVQQKREADEQQKSVAAYSEKISAEEVKCKTMADNAQRDLDEAVPALDEAMKVIFAICQRHTVVVWRAGDRSYVTGSIHG